MCGQNEAQEISNMRFVLFFASILNEIDAQFKPLQGNTPSES